MQGIRVKGSLVWTIYRFDDGPMRAYKNLGEDLKLRTPVSANDKLVSMSNAILRNYIANKELKTIMTDRQILRDTIRKEIGKITKDWGVWIETVEITNVEICSDTLFKNMQTKYRETIQKEADIIRNTIKNRIEEVTMEVETEMNELDKSASQEIKAYKDDIDVKLNNEINAINIMKNKIANEKYKIEQDLDVSKKMEMEKHKDSINNSDLDLKLAEIQISIEKENAKIKTKDVEYEQDKLEQEHEQKVTSIETEYKLASERLQIELMQP